MQRPRNRQNRPQQQNGCGRGTGPSNRGSRSILAAVPRITQVVSGAAVSVVLKSDQPTGKESQGFVSEVLTRGDHPRGIKVRLADGRVGRVLRMVTEDEARVGSEGLVGLGRNGEVSPTARAGNSGFESGARSMSTVATRFSQRYHDVRNEEHAPEPSRGYGLDDFLPEGHPLKAAQPVVTKTTTQQADGKTTLHNCPVCGNFEGDEIAVSRHVDEHFD